MSAKKTLLIDANLILRLLRNDHAEHSKLARDLFTRATRGELVLHVSSYTIAEVAHVLRSGYKVSRTDSASALIKVINLSGVSLGAETWVLDGLQRYLATNVDIADCFLAAQSVALAKAVVSFDADLKKFRDITRLSPDQVK